MKSIFIDLWKHRLPTEQFPGSVYVGSSKNQKDLKDLVMSIFIDLWDPQSGLRAQGYLTYKKTHPSRTLPYAYA